MRSDTYMWIGLFTGCAVALWFGLESSAVTLFAAGMVFLQIPVATSWARRRRNRSLGLVLGAAVLTFGIFRSLHATLYFSAVASVGIVLGLGLARRWTYGWTAGAAAAVAYGLVAGHALYFWDVWLASGHAWLDAWTSQLAAQADAGPQAMALRETLWLRQHWAEVGLGLVFSPVLIGACIMLSLTVKRLRRMEDVPETRGSFSQMRTPEWVVWIAILLAGLWFFDRAWPNAVLRLVTWNAAVALSAVYWVNGTSILVYAFGAFRPSLLVCCASMMMLFMLGVHPVLCAVGLFDTWSNFRMTVDRVIASRERGQRFDNHEDDGEE